VQRKIKGLEVSTVTFGMNVTKQNTAILNDQELDAILKKARLPANFPRLGKSFPMRIVRQLSRMKKIK
jgi:hypothetical protein